MVIFLYILFTNASIASLIPVFNFADVSNLLSNSISVSFFLYLLYLFHLFPSSYVYLVYYMFLIINNNTCQ